VCAEAISEPQFLLTELRYTLGQLNVQLGDLTTRQEQEGGALHPSVREILDTMTRAERKYQEQYSRLTGVGLPEKVPVQDEGSPAAGFEQLRIGTIALLEQAQPEWTPELIEAVRQQVADDRQRTTLIAEERKRIFESDQRPDLDEPLTAQ